MTDKSSHHLRGIVFIRDPATIVAEARGLLAAEALSVEMVLTPNSTVQMRGVSDGSYDFAFTAFDNVLAWSGRDGTEVVAVAQTDRLLLPVVARPEVRGWQDLRGRALAVDAVDTAFALVLRRILLAHGLDFAKGDYTLVPVGGTGARFESMLRGETFAAILNPPYDAKAAAAGMALLGDHREVLPDYPGTTLAVARTWAETHREDLVGFLRAWWAAARWIDDHHAEARELLADTYGERDPLGMLAYGPPDPRGLQCVLDLRLTFGYQLLMGADLTRYYDASFFQRATHG